MSEKAKRVVNGWVIHWHRTFWSDRNNDHIDYVVVEAEDSPGFYAFGTWDHMWDFYGFPVNQCGRGVSELIALVDMWESEGLNNFNNWPDMEHFRDEVVGALRKLQEVTA